VSIIVNVSDAIMRCVQLVLAEVLEHEFHVTLHDSQTISDVSNMRGRIYAFETSSRDNNTTSTNHVISVIAISCDARKSRRYFHVMFNR